MKAELVAGDTLDFTTSVPDYPATDGYTLTFRLVPRSGSAITFDAAADGSDYRVQEGPSVTALWGAGEYAWSSYVHKSGIRYTVDSGLVTILPDPAAMAVGTDTRSNARKTLDALETLLAGKPLAGDVVQYQINGRMLTRMSYGDLILARDRYAALVKAEENAERVNKGLGARNKLLVRM